MRKLLIGTSRKIEYSIRCDFFSHLQKIHSSFFTSTRTGSIMALMTNDLDAVRSFLGPGLLNLFNTIFVFISTLAVMFMINVKLSLYSLIAIPILPIIVSKLSAALYHRFKKSQEQYASLSARTQESFAGIKVIKSFTQEKNEIKTFSDLNIEYIKRNLSLAKVRSMFWPAMVFIGGIGTLAVLLVGGRQAINQVITLGQFVQFTAYIGSITWPLISLGWVMNLVQRGSVSMGRINRIFEIKPEIASPRQPVMIKTIKGNIDFKNVYFRYSSENSPKNYSKGSSKGSIKYSSLNYKNIANNTFKNSKKWVLKNINLKIKQGMKVGIVGFTGSGKSTLVNLIPRLYDPQNGAVYIDNLDIKSISLHKLRQHIGYVAQEPFLFSKSIKENILFGSKDLLLDLNKTQIIKKVKEVSKISHLHEEIENFPSRYETIIGERGVTLSGGQKQRLAISRALITQPSILILDDSFSNIDTHTEELILTDLREKVEDITTIIISHRISTIKDSDLIIVIDNGEIIESGNHSQLLKKSSVYQRLYSRQQLSEELEEEI